MAPRSRSFAAAKGSFSQWDVLQGLPERRQIGRHPKADQIIGAQ
jgi:hypothetical protein